MKYPCILLLCFLLLHFQLFAQTTKSITPLPAEVPQSGTKAGATYAVVVGISDYQDPAIPDLRFADRDAEAFAAWLRSPAGGSLPDAQLKILLNKDATTGKMIAALDGLISASKSGDEAIIYFSGHGDVERVTKFQRGYWLTFDSPPAVYAAGAFSLQYLQDIITTLSEAGVQAIVITDACRAGKLAGSEFGGSKATSAALAQQFANEIKILSCQPDEFSLEGEQWGGGRGCFSYHLIDALYGMADGNADGTVNLLELGRYLEDKVPAEAAPQSQIPFTVGSKTARLATVDGQALAHWKQQKGSDIPAFQKIDSRGLEDLLLARADTGVLEMYHAFTAALEAGNLMSTDSTAGKSADDYYKKLIQEPSIAELHGLMTRNFAAALMDEGQQVVNLLLKTDPQTVDYLYTNGRIDYKGNFRKMKRAAELLGEQHYMFKSLKAKEAFFEAKTYWVSNFSSPNDSFVTLRKQVLQKGLEYNPEAAFLWMSIGEYPMGLFYGIDSLKLFATKLDTLAPSWPLGHFEVASSFFSNLWHQKIKLEELDFAIARCQKAIDADSTFLPPYWLLGWLYECVGAYNLADKHCTLFVQKMKNKIRANPGQLFAFEYQNLGNTLWRLRRYKEGVEAFKVAETIAKGGRDDVITSLSIIYADMGMFEEAEKTKWLSSGDLYQYYLNDNSKAEEAYLKIIPFWPTNGYCQLLLKTGRLLQAVNLSDNFLNRDSNNLETLFMSGEYHRLLGDTSIAIERYKKVVDWNNYSYLQYRGRLGANLLQLIALNRLGRIAELALAMKRYVDIYQNDPWLHFALACFYASTDEPDKALVELKNAENQHWQPAPAIEISGTVKDPFLDPLRHLPEFQAWEKRWSPPYKDYSKD